MTRFKVIVFAVGVLGLADTAVVLVIGGGINLGTIVPGVAGIFLTAWALLTRKAGLDFAFLRQRSIKSFSFAIFCCGVGSFLIVQALILFHAFNPNPPETNWCIVLGAGLREDQPTLTLRNRLLSAITYLEKHRNTQVIVSGGQGPGETITEAEAMKRFLISKGISAARIHLEDRATSTAQNLEFSKEIIVRYGDNQEQSIGVISSDFHLFRVGMLSKRQGMRVSLIPAPTPWYLLPNVCIREYFAFAKSYVLDR